MDATIWCTCPRCYGRRYTSIVDYLGDHAGIEVRESEVRFEEPPRAEPYNPTQVYIGTMDEDGPLQVLCQVYPPEGIVELSFRRHAYETWSAPVELSVAS